MSSMPPPPPPPAALHQPHPELLWSRPTIVVKEQGPSRLKLYLKLFNNRGVCVVFGVGVACLVGVYVSLLALVKWDPTLGVVALLPAFLCLLAFAIYRTIAPLEEFVFDRESLACVGTTTRLCSTASTRLEGVTHVRAMTHEFPSSDGVGLPGRQSKGLQLHIYHAGGVHVAKTLWPVGEIKVREAVRRVNIFLDAACLTTVAPGPTMLPPRCVDVVAVEPAINIDEFHEEAPSPRDKSRSRVFVTIALGDQEMKEDKTASNAFSPERKTKSTGCLTRIPGDHYV